MTTSTKSNVLLLDDDKFLLDMYARKFTAAGYIVQAFLSVDDALKALRTGFVPDAMVFDLVMPEHDGFYFLETIGKEKLASKASRIALTNESDESVKTKATQLGADQVILKAGFIPSEVVNIIGEAIASHKA